MTHLPILVASAQVVSFIWEALVWKALTANERECRGCAFHDSVAFKKTFNRLKKELWRNSVTVRKLHTQRRAQVGLSLSLSLSFILCIYKHYLLWSKKHLVLIWSPSWRCVPQQERNRECRRSAAALTCCYTASRLPSPSTCSPSVTHGASVLTSHKPLPAVKPCVSDHF